MDAKALMNVWVICQEKRIWNKRVIRQIVIKEMLVMRKVRIVSSSELPMLHTSNDLEVSLNSAFVEIDKKGGKIVKTEYFASHHGTLQSAIIEYEIL